MAPKSNQLSKIDLTTFFLSIASAAYIGLGVVPSPNEESPRVDLELARQNIDLLELMEEKTRGNRSPEEDRLIEQLLFETRMKFIEKQREIELK
jgi:hypothetical protein